MMVTLSAKTPLGLLEFAHAGKKATAKGPPIAVAEWEDAATRGKLYDPFGHIFNADNCFISDLVSAIQQFAGEGSVTVPKHIKEQIEQEMREVPSDELT